MCRCLSMRMEFFAVSQTPTMFLAMESCSGCDESARVAVGYLPTPMSFVSTVKHHKVHDTISWYRLCEEQGVALRFKNNFNAHTSQKRFDKWHEISPLERHPD